MYKVTIGLEVHCQIKTESKNFSSAKNTYSEYPHENVDVVDLGLPGVLPVANKDAFKKKCGEELIDQYNIIELIMVDYLLDDGLNIKISYDKIYIENSILENFV